MWLRGIARALVALVLIAVAASSMLSGRLGTSTDVPSVYADSSAISIHDENDRDREKKDENRQRDEGPDNTNDNSDDVDPNCAHTWGR